MNSNSDVTSDAKCRRGLRAVSEITIKTLANYLKLDYESLAEEDLLELATFLQTAVCFIFRSSDKSQVIYMPFPEFFWQYPPLAYVFYHMQ